MLSCFSSKHPLPEQEQLTVATGIDYSAAEQIVVSFPSLGPVEILEQGAALFGTVQGMQPPLRRTMVTHHVAWGTEMKIAEAKVTKGLGYEICHRDFPLQIML
jgi:hypothetical protein